MEEPDLSQGFPRGGWIYVIMTSDDYNTFKLGFTRDNPFIRFKKIRTSRPEAGIEVVYFVPDSVARFTQVEAALKREFADYVIRFHEEWRSGKSDRSEWFRYPAREAAQHIEYWLEDLQDKPVASSHMFGQEVICRFYEAELDTLFYGSLIPPNPIDGLPM